MKFGQLSLSAIMILNAMVTATTTVNPSTSIQDAPEISSTSFLHSEQENGFMDARNQLYNLAAENAKELLGIGKEQLHPNQRYFNDMIEMLIIKYYNVQPGEKRQHVIQELKTEYIKGKRELLNSLTADIARDCKLSFIRFKRIPSDVLSLFNPLRLHLDGTDICDGLSCLSSLDNLVTLNLDNNNFQSLEELNNLSSQVQNVSIAFNPLKPCRIKRINRKKTIKTIRLCPIKNASAEFMEKLKTRFERVEIVDPTDQNATTPPFQNIRVENCSEMQILQSISELTPINSNENASIGLKKLYEAINVTISKTNAITSRLKYIMKSINIVELWISKYLSPEDEESENPSVGDLNETIMNFITMQLLNIEYWLEITKNEIDFVQKSRLTIKDLDECSSLWNTVRIVVMQDKMYSIGHDLSKSKLMVISFEDKIEKYRSLIMKQLLRLNNTGASMSY